MDINEFADQYMEELKNLSIKYHDYTQAMPSRIVGRDPQNDNEKQIAGSSARNTNWVIGIGCLAFLATTIFAFCTGQIKGGMISLVGTVVLLYFCAIPFISKPKVAYGTAVWKHFRYNNYPREGSKMFFLTVIFEEPEKIIVKDIQTTRESYEAIAEGTPVIVVKKGNLCMAKIY